MRFYQIHKMIMGKKRYNYPTKKKIPIILLFKFVWQFHFSTVKFVCQPFSAYFSLKRQKSTLVGAFLLIFTFNQKFRYRHYRTTDGVADDIGEREGASDHYGDDRALGYSEEVNHVYQLKQLHR